MKLPRSIQKLIDSFERLPGIGPKTAQRLTFYLLHFPEHIINDFSDALKDLKVSTKLCSICKNVSEFDTCSVCSDLSRNANMIAVVAHPLDAFALEKTSFKGVYHVLHGIIDPLNGIGPEEIFIANLFSRVNNLVQSSSAVEIILATNSSMEGEGTAMYISRTLREKFPSSDLVKITRLARGLPVGGDIEYADDITLTRAFEGRVNI